MTRLHPLSPSVHLGVSEDWFRWDTAGNAFSEKLRNRWWVRWMIWSENQMLKTRRRRPGDPSCELGNLSHWPDMLTLEPLGVSLCWGEQQKKVEMHKKSAFESYWTVNPLSLFFLSWCVYWCLSHLLSYSERTTNGTGSEELLSLVPAGRQDFSRILQQLLVFHDFL